MEVWARGRSSKADFLCISVAGRNVAQLFRNTLKLESVVLCTVKDAMPRFGQLGCAGFIVLDGQGAVVDAKTPAFLDFGEEAFRYVESLLGRLCAQPLAFEWPCELGKRTLVELKAIARDRSVDGSPCIEKREMVHMIVMDQIAKLSSGQLKKIIQTRGLDPSNCLMRSELVNLIFTHGLPVQVASTEDQSHADATTCHGNASEAGAPAQAQACAGMPSYESTLTCADGTCETPKKKVKCCESPFDKTQTQQCVDSVCESEAKTSSFKMLAPASVGHYEMDEEHERCVHAVNDLASNRTAKALKHVYQVFFDHFKHEESEMVKVGTFGSAKDHFSALASHSKDHERILSKIQAIYDRVIDGPDGAATLADADLEIVASAFHKHASSFDALYEGQLADAACG